MSATRVSQRSSFNSRSISKSSSSALSLSGGMQVVGTRISNSGGYQVRAPSVYGGAGGFGTRISQSSFTFGSGSLVPYGDMSVVSNEKGTMQNLNDRLASYLEKVRSLEAANRKLELQIGEFCEKRTTVSRDLSGYFANISELQTKIARRRLENHGVVLQIDNAQLAAEDFKMKFETELNMRTMVEADVLRLRGVRDSLTITISDLEMQIEGLKEDLAYTKTNHQEELHLLRAQQTGKVNVEVDSVESADLTNILEELREQYGTLVEKNKIEIERWYQMKLDEIKVIITTTSSEVQTFHTQLSEVKRTLQSLEITRESILTEIQCLQQNMSEVNGRNGAELSQLQIFINQLEEELQHLRASTDQQKSEYCLLLDIKMRLELEIAEYRRLLEGGQYEKKTVIISKTVEEHKPHIEMRVKTITEQLVDGKVVSTLVDTTMQDIE